MFEIVEKIIRPSSLAPMNSDIASFRLPYYVSFNSDRYQPPGQPQDIASKMCPTPGKLPNNFSLGYPPSPGTFNKIKNLLYPQNMQKYDF